jgi:hypothetical protein
MALQPERRPALEAVFGMAREQGFMPIAVVLSPGYASVEGDRSWVGRLRVCLQPIGVRVDVLDGRQFAGITGGRIFDLIGMA